MSLNMHPKPIAARAGSSTLVNSLALAGLLAATLALSACGTVSYTHLTLPTILLV